MQCISWHNINLEEIKAEQAAAQIAAEWDEAAETAASAAMAESTPAESDQISVRDKAEPEPEPTTELEPEPTTEEGAQRGKLRKAFKEIKKLRKALKEAEEREADAKLVIDLQVPWCTADDAYAFALNKEEEEAEEDSVSFDFYFACCLTPLQQETVRVRAVTKKFWRQESKRVRAESTRF